MDETRFSSLVRQAIGEEAMHPWLTSAVRARLAEPPARVGASRLPLLIAAVLVMVVTAAAWFAPQFYSRRSNQTTAPAASPIPSPVAVDPANCRLPVLLVQRQHGFIDTSSAGFIPDTSAPTDADSYSPVVGRWLPVQYAQVSPDGRSYAWIEDNRLYRHDIASNSDVFLMTANQAIYFWRWDYAGILIGSQPLNLTHPNGYTWLIDPTTGAFEAHGIAQSSGFPFQPLPGDPHGVAGKSGAGFRALGTDAQGRTIWWFYNLDYPGAVDWVFYETAPGQRVYIFKGTQGDATGFDPDSAFGDATGVWFLDHNHNAIWHWQPGGELTKVQPPPRASMILVAAIAGPCF